MHCGFPYGRRVYSSSHETKLLQLRLFLLYENIRGAFFEDFFDRGTPDPLKMGRFNNTDNDSIEDGTDLGKSLRDLPGPQHFHTEEDLVGSLKDPTDMCRCYGTCANHNGRIDGDNGDGKWSESETWTELNPNAKDTDGDTFDDDERGWGYNPLSTDTDKDGLSDDDEDKDRDGVKDSSETSVQINYVKTGELLTNRKNCGADTKRDNHRRFSRNANNCNRKAFYISW